MPFNELFGGAVLLPADLSYLSLTVDEDIELVWPTEQQVGGTLVVADIIDLTAGAPGLNVDMPDARLVSPGTSVLFNNVGAQTVTIRDQAGAPIISLTSGTTWMVYLRDNQTEAGLWRTFQFGASVSVANAAALAGAGLKAIGATLNTRVPVSVQGVNYAILDSDRAVALIWTSGVGQFDLPNAATVGADWYCIVRNSGNGDLSVIPPSGTIDGAASATFPPGSSAFVVSDGANYFTVGFGSGVSGGGGDFDFVAINVAGSGDFTLSGSNLGRIGYRFTGVLTGTRNIVVPNTTDEYWVDNQTTGAFSLFVKTAAQTPGVEVQQGNRNILYCDGTNVLAAESATVSFPIAVAQGGTGAITAAAARTNLGATTTGNSLFTAADAAAARTALGATATGSSVLTAVNAAAARTAIGAAAAGLIRNRNVSSAGSLIAGDEETAIEFNGTTSYIFQLNGSLPNNSTVTLINSQNTGTITLQADGTLTWLNGSDTAPVTGNRTLLRSGLVTAWYRGSGNWTLLGGVGIA